MAHIKRRLVVFLLLGIVTIVVNLIFQYMILHRGRLATNGSNLTIRLAIKSSGDQHPTNFSSGYDTRRSLTPMRSETTINDWWCSGRLEPSKQIPRDGSYSVKEENKSVLDKHFLTAVLVVRIFASDKNQLTTRELVQWLQYISWAGVEHVYVYDSYHYKSESQRENLRCFIENGFVTYVDWSHRVKRNISGLERAMVTQLPAYQNCIDIYGHEFIWQTAIDIDEYPYSSKDRAPGFLRRVVQKIAQEQKRNIGQIFMKEYLFLGQPLNVSQHPLLIDRLWRRNKKPRLKNYSTRKPIYIARAVSMAHVHANFIRQGYVQYYPTAGLLRMNHYHGARHNFTEAELLKRTRKDWGMKTAVLAMQPCLNACYLGCC